MNRRSFLSLFPPILLPWLFNDGSEPAVHPQLEYNFQFVNLTEREALSTMLRQMGNEGWLLCTMDSTQPLRTILVFARLRG